MRLAAHAKVNLTLEVLGMRPDGYHELRSVVSTIPLHDDVELLDAPAGEVTVEMSGDGMEAPCVPCEENLAVCAARAVRHGNAAERHHLLQLVRAVQKDVGSFRMYFTRLICHANVAAKVGVLPARVGTRPPGRHDR